MSYDLAIVNATVVDGTGSAPRVDDVAVRGDRVVRIGPLDAAATRVIDAWGAYLTPGVVDLHGHSDYSLFADPLARSKVLQGVTTEVGGNCGYHAAPVFGKIAAQRRREQRAGAGLDLAWETSADYRAALTEARPSMNYAQQIGYNTLRSAVTDDHARPLDDHERTTMRDLVRAELVQGAVGLSYGVAYAPACFARTEELIDVAEEAAAAGVMISFHLRNEDATLIEALDEALLIGRASGAATHIGHLKTFRRPNWAKLEDAFARLEAAAASGLDLTVDRYPHLAMNTLLKFILPIWALEGGDGATRARLGEPAVRARIAAELHASGAGEAREVLLSLVSRPELKPHEGRFLDQIAGARDPWEVACELVAAEGDCAFATIFGMNRDNLDRILDLDRTIVASDASVQAIERQLGGGQPHPRCFDTFPYFLAEWVVQRGRFTIERAIRKITSQPAARAGLRDRGTLVEGAFADLALFDPDGLAARVSYEEPIRYPEGVELVVVNGQVVVEEGRHTGARPGRVLTRFG